jgi:hypothetical protein
MNENNKHKIVPEHRRVTCIQCHKEITVQSLTQHIEIVHEGKVYDRFKNSKFKQLQAVPKTEIARLFQETNSVQGILNSLNTTRDPRCTTYVNSVLMEFGITRKPSVREDMIARADEILNIAKTAPSISSLLQSLGISTVRRGMYETVTNILKQNDIQLPKRFVWTKELIFCVDSKFPKGHLSAQVKKYKLFEYKCSICSMLPMWNDKPLTLQVDHINGINNDHRKENLRWVCPNCHSQTETFCKSNR